MEKLLIIHLFNMSISASWLVLAVVLLRLLLKKAPKAITVALWALVGVRLLLPFSIESALSLIPSAKTIPQEIVYAKEPTIDSGITAINRVVNPMITESFAPGPELRSINPIQVFFAFAELFWMVGMAVMILYMLISYLRLHRQVREVMPLRDNIYVCDRIPSPFILGIFRPRIYLPSTMENADIEYVIAHEKAHLRRRDHLWKPLGFLLLTVYWFNPILWVAYILLCRDIELACDERVIRDMNADDKKAYSTALLNCSAPRRMISACPLAFGEVGVKQRIKSVLHYKKPTFWIILVALVATVGVAVGFLTDPKSETDSDLSALRNHTYAVVSVPYESPLLSSIVIPGQGTPFYTVTGDFTLLRKAASDEEWVVLGMLSEITLTEDGFDALFDFTDGLGWADGVSAASLRKENARAWKLGSEDLTYLLQQKDGTVFLANGHRTKFARVFELKADMNTDIGITGGVTPPHSIVSSTLSQVNVHEGTQLYMDALNRNKMYISSVQHLPLYKIESTAELEGFVQRYGGEIDFSYKSSPSDAPSFTDATAKYDDAFFAENALFAVYIFAPQCDNEYKLASSHFSKEGSAFHIVTEKQGQLEAILQYMMLIEVNREAIEGCKVFDATLDAVGVEEETIVGTWETDGAVFIFREDGTGAEIIPTTKDRKFVYAVEEKFLTLTYTDVDETASDHFMQFSYEQTRDMMRLGDLRSSSFNDTLELTRISYDAPTPIDDVDLQSAGEGVLQFLRWPDIPEEPKKAVDTLSFSFENRESYGIARGEHLEYIDNLRLESNADGTYTLSFQLFQDALPYIEPLFLLLNSTVTLSYEGERFDALDTANEHTLFLLNGEKAVVTEVRSGAGNGHRDFYFILQTTDPIAFEDLYSFEFVIS